MKKSASTYFTFQACITQRERKVIQGENFVFLAFGASVFLEKLHVYFANTQWKGLIQDGKLSVVDE